MQANTSIANSTKCVDNDNDKNFTKQNCRRFYGLCLAEYGEETVCRRDRIPGEF